MRPGTKRRPTTSRSWRCYAGTHVIDLGKRKNGKPWRTLVNVVFVVHGKTDMMQMQKLHPHLKFIEEED